MNFKKKKDASFAIGLVIGIAVGIALHHLGLGVAFGIIMGLALREVYERKYSKGRDMDRM
ncbi:hypothetical protein [Mucilaginibacter sp.]|uniref:hypothetical protein n=1 Tax=Mucilaginibacter sp. TaxID=1882438 RepID=UPI00261A2139|nr:hypothetical protein [Mucilaginibacter sp.]